MRKGSHHASKSKEKCRVGSLGNRNACGVRSEDTRKKMSKRRKISGLGNKNALGFKHTDQWKEEQSKRKMGKNCTFYIDGRCCGNNQPYNTKPEHKNWAIQIRKRDDYTCQLCDKEGFCAHHIDYNKDNFDLDNGVCLCRICHPKTNVCRGYWIDFFKKMMKAKEEGVYVNS